MSQSKLKFWRYGLCILFGALPLHGWAIAPATLEYREIRKELTESNISSERALELVERTERCLESETIEPNQRYLCLALWTLPRARSLPLDQSARERLQTSLREFRKNLPSTVHEDSLRSALDETAAMISSALESARGQ